MLVAVRLRCAWGFGTTRLTRLQRKGHAAKPWTRCEADPEGSNALCCHGSSTLSLRVTPPWVWAAANFATASITSLVPTRSTFDWRRAQLDARIRLRGPKAQPVERMNSC